MFRVFFKSIFSDVIMLTGLGKFSSIVIDVIFFFLCRRFDLYFVSTTWKRTQAQVSMNKIIFFFSFLVLKKLNNQELFTKKKEKERGKKK